MANINYRYSAFRQLILSVNGIDMLDTNKENEDIRFFLITKKFRYRLIFYIFAISYNLSKIHTKRKNQF